MNHTNPTMTLPHASALQTLLTTSHPPNSPLPLQIAHNLHHQHHWTHLRIHPPTSPSDRPLLSGLPPKTLYLHPDEQLALLQRQHTTGADPTLPPEREWVLPARLEEKWTLRMFGEVFDSMARIPGRREGDVVFGDDEEEEGEGEEEEGGRDGSQWRETQPKRLLMAIVDEDSTVVYYIVHDGIVKPRQN